MAKMTMFGSKKIRFNHVFREFLFGVSSLLISAIPQVLINLFSELIGNWIKIDTSTGAWSVVAVSIASVIMYWLGRKRIDPDGPHNTPKSSDYNSKYFLMQGSMFSLALIMSQICQDVYSGPLTLESFIHAAMALIPALEGALGAQFIHVVNNQPVYYLDLAINELIRDNSRVNEKMIQKYAKKLGDEDHASPFASLDEDEIKNLIRSRMTYLVTSGWLDGYSDSSQRIVIDSSRDPDLWRVQKKDMSPRKAYVPSPPDGQSGLKGKHLYEEPDTKPTANRLAAQKGAQIEEQKFEQRQRNAWQKWLTSNDENAIYELLEQSWHTKQGLSKSLEIEIEGELNRMILSSETRRLTHSEEVKIMYLRKLLHWGVAK